MAAYTFTLLLCLIVLLLPVPCQGELVGYSGVQDFKVESDELIVEHHHDWSHATDSSRYAMISTHQDPFRSDNDYAYIQCTNKQTGKILWQHPTPALTYLWISPDSKFIVGCSNINLWNPYQLVIFDCSGKLLLKKHIAPSEAGMTRNEFTLFSQKFPGAVKWLHDFLFYRNDSVYVDFIRMDMPKRLGQQAWHYLFNYVTASPYLSSCSETTSWIYWFDNNNPSPQLHFTDTALIAISLRDDWTGLRFEIPIQ